MNDKCAIIELQYMMGVCSDLASRLSQLFDGDVIIITTERHTDYYGFIPNIQLHTGSNKTKK